MNQKRINKIFVQVLFIGFFILSQAYSQGSKSIPGDNIRATILEDHNVIYYDLSGVPEDEFEVSVFLFFTQSRDSIRLESITGNIGRGVRAGKEKVVIWRFNEEQSLKNRNPDADVEFRIWANRISINRTSFFRGSTIYWIAGGALAVGAGITFLLLSKNQETTPVKIIEMPDPVGLGLPPR